MRVLGKLVGGQQRRWYWSCRLDSGVLERLGTNALWGRYWDTYKEAMIAYSQAVIDFPEQRNQEKA